MAKQTWALPSILSSHALIRFMERGLGVDLAPYRSADPARPRENEYEFLARIRREGLDVDKVVDRMLSPSVRAAIDAGARLVRIEGVNFVVRGRRIVTVLEPDYGAQGYRKNKTYNRYQERNADEQRRRPKSSRRREIEEAVHEG